MPETSNISLVISDVDGTLVTDDKHLTQRNIEAVRALRAAGIRFAITSSRPPRGMAMLFEPLGIDTPVGGFNGGLFVDTELNVMAEKIIDPDTARRAIDLIGEQKLDAWVFRGNDWLITRREGAYVDHEIDTVGFQPTIVSDLTDKLDGIAKIVGVSDDFDRVEKAETAAGQALGQRTTVARSQSYYLDFTHLDANKGAVVDYLSSELGVPKAEIAAIGDNTNDVPMLTRAGFSIAMGNAPDAVKKMAGATTSSNADSGFAEAIDRHILGRTV